VVLARRRTEKSGISGNGVRRNSGVDETAGWVEREKVLNGTRSSSERKKRTYLCTENRYKAGVKGAGRYKKRIWRRSGYIESGQRGVQELCCWLVGLSAQKTQCLRNQADFR